MLIRIRCIMLSVVLRGDRMTMQACYPRWRCANLPLMLHANEVQAAFRRKRRSMLAADVIDELGGVVDELSESH